MFHILLCFTVFILPMAPLKTKKKKEDKNKFGSSIRLIEYRLYELSISYQQDKILPQSKYK